MSAVSCSPDGERDELRITFGPDAVVQQGVRKTLEVAPGIAVEYGAGGQLIAVTISEASTRLHPDVLTAGGPNEEWLSLTDSGASIGVAPGTLRVQLNAKRLTGRKIGRGWFLERRTVESYAQRKRDRLMRMLRAASASAMAIR